MLTDRLSPVAISYTRSYSTAALGIGAGNLIVIVSAEAVDAGPKAELFRVRAHASGDSPFAPHMHERADVPAELILSSLLSQRLQMAILRKRQTLTTDLAGHGSQTVEALVDWGMVVSARSKPVLVIAHNDEVPTEILLSSSAETIEAVLADAHECILL